jgi:CRISPR/Cas system-associated exonuclease Cas4 (RecB family)
MNRLIVALMCLCSVVLCDWAGCAELRTGDVVLVPKEEVKNEDLLAACVRARIEGCIKGDLATVGASEVRVSGPIEGYAILVGRNLDVRSPIRNDAWVLGQAVTVSSTVADNAYAAGSAVVFTNKSRVVKDLFVAGGAVNIHGNVGRDVRAAARTLVIDASVSGNIYAKADQIRLLDRAVIKGNLYYESSNPLFRSPKAKVLGRVIHKLPPKEKAKPVFWTWLAGWLRRLAAAIVFGAVLLAAVPQTTIRVAETVTLSFWRSLAVGLLAAIVVPIASVIALISIIGVPLGCAALMAYALLLYASGLLVALAVGSYIARALIRQPIPRVAVLTVGCIVLGVVYQLPWIGWLLKLVVTLVGLGAICWEICEALRRSRSSNQPRLLDT